MKIHPSMHPCIITLAAIILAALLPTTLQAHSKAFTPDFVDRLVAPYLVMQTALATDDLEAAKAGAAAFADAMQHAPREGDADAESAALEGPAQAIAKADELPEARVAFQALSRELTP